MYGCESWTVKKAEHQRIHAFELWCWRRLLGVSWTAGRSSQSILKEISTGCSLEGMMLKLKLQYFGHLMWRVNSLGKTLMLGGIGGRRRRERQRIRWLDGITDSMDVSWVNSRSRWWTVRPGVLRFMGSQRVGYDWDWSELNWSIWKSKYLFWPCRQISASKEFLSVLRADNTISRVTVMLFWSCITKSNLQQH